MLEDRNIVFKHRATGRMVTVVGRVEERDDMYIVMNESGFVFQEFPIADFQWWYETELT